jgi:hypothetical protein
VKGQPSRDNIKVTAAEQLDLIAWVSGTGNPLVGGVKVTMAAAPAQDAKCRSAQAETGRDGNMAFVCEFARGAANGNKAVRFTAQLAEEAPNNK